MKNKNLPIKIFNKRQDKDEKRKEGMSSNDLPKWVLTIDELQNKIEEFKKPLGEIGIILKRRRDIGHDIPAVLKLKLRSKALAKNHRYKVWEIFNVNKKFNFLGMSDDSELIVKIDNENDLKAINNNIHHIEDHIHGLSSIDELNVFVPHVDSSDDILKARLINFNDYTINREVESLFIKKMEEAEISYKRTKYADDLTLYKFKSLTDRQIAVLESFDAIYSLVPMPKVDINLDSTLETFSVQTINPIDGIDYPLVGILDSGIERIPQLENWIIEDSFSSYPDHMLNKNHGTFVAGVLIYGDSLEGQDWTESQGCKIFSAAVFPDELVETITEDDLIENIREAIQYKPEIKIWNLSLGTRSECDLNEFSDFGKFLDDIQKTNNILICKSAGNCDNYKTKKVAGRIAKSADSLRSLVVGSLAHKKSLNDFSDINCSSPFSRVGFGPNNIVKPDVTHYGGNSGLRNDGKSAMTGVYSFTITGHTVSNIGTSFSTPRVTSLASGLNYNINDDFNSLLVKALIIHSAKYPDNTSTIHEEKLKNMGYGLPSSVNNILYNSPNEITLILQDSLVKGKYNEILDFPFPQSMVENGFYYGEITLTMVSSPICENNNSVEYCQSNIDVSFGTYDKIKARPIEKPHILNEYGMVGQINLLRETLYSKKILADTKNSFLAERQLRNYGKKYHNVKKYSINLEELTQANKNKSLIPPKKWFLKLEGLYGAFVEKRALLDGEELKQDFCLIITIKDRKNNNQVYNNVTQLLNEYNFIHKDVQIRNNVQVNNR